MESDFINNITNLLINNKKFPSYQAERRIDIFLNVFIEGILGAYYPDSKITFIAPEFPLRKKDNYQSTHVDYLCLKQTDDGIKQILFVELKIDSHSFRKEQLDIYKSFKTWGDCLKGLVEIIKSGTMSFLDRLKYFHLIKVLEENQLIWFEKSLSSIQIPVYNPTRKEQLNFTWDFKNFLNTTKIADIAFPIKVIYIAPENIRKQKCWDNNLVELLSFEWILNEKVNTTYPEEWLIIKDNLLKQFKSKTKFTNDIGFKVNINI
jgi:hypothetical protein